MSQFYSTILIFNLFDFIHFSDRPIILKLVLRREYEMFGIIILKKGELDWYTFPIRRRKPRQSVLSNYFGNVLSILLRVR